MKKYRTVARTINTKTKKGELTKTIWEDIEYLVVEHTKISKCFILLQLAALAFHVNHINLRCGINGKESTKIFEKGTLQSIQG